MATFEDAAAGGHVDGEEPPSAVTYGALEVAFHSCAAFAHPKLHAANCQAAYHGGLRGSGTMVAVLFAR